LSISRQRENRVYNKYAGYKAFQPQGLEDLRETKLDW
jgi:hypothetical protein